MKALGIIIIFTIAWGCKKASPAPPAPSAALAENGAGTAATGACTLRNNAEQQFCRTLQTKGLCDQWRKQVGPRFHTVGYDPAHACKVEWAPATQDEVTEFQAPGLTALKSHDCWCADHGGLCKVWKWGDREARIATKGVCTLATCWELFPLVDQKLVQCQNRLRWVKNFAEIYCGSAGCAGQAPRGDQTRSNPADLFNKKTDP